MMKPLIVLSLTLAACADQPISYSDDVGIALKADVVDGTVVDEKNINTESGNPYAAFITDAHNALHADPGSIEVDRVEAPTSAPPKSSTMSLILRLPQRRITKFGGHRQARQNPVL